MVHLFILGERSLSNQKLEPCIGPGSGFGFGFGFRLDSDRVRPEFSLVRFISGSGQIRFGSVSSLNRFPGFGFLSSSGLDFWPEFFRFGSVRIGFGPEFQLDLGFGPDFLFRVQFGFGSGSSQNWFLGILVLVKFEPRFSFRIF